jgi:hypothetical protein
MPSSRPRIAAALSLVVAGFTLTGAVAPALAGPSISTRPASIVGGTRTTVSEFPTVVAILNVVNNEVQSLCTGTLIHPEWVLTAAHCLLPSELGVTSQAEVTAHTLIALDTTTALNGTTGRHIRAAATFPHPSFSPDNLGDNDIGLIHLAEKVTDRRVTAINRVFNDARPGVSAVMVGFGASTTIKPAVGEPTNAGTEFVLRDRASTKCATLPIANVHLDDSNLLCFSQQDKKGKCNGDSGGPSFATIGGVNHVIGITSFGDADCTYMGADTRVDAEAAFLDQHIPDLACVHDGLCQAACGQGALPADVDCTSGGARALGAVCTGSDDCDSALCATSGDDKLCTERCVVADKGACPTGFACTQSGDTAVCWPHKADAGGCSAGGDASLWLMAVGLWGLRRRPRAR